MISVKIKLPETFCKVRCTHNSNPNLWQPSMTYWFNPSDNSFRTKRGNNKTKRIAKWELTGSVVYKLK